MIDKLSPTWKTIEEWAKNNLDNYIQDLVICKGRRKTEQLRGSIWVLQDLLKLVDEDKGRKGVLQDPAEDKFPGPIL